MFDELFEKTRNTNEEVNKADFDKVEPHVRKTLAHSFAGQRLKDAVEDVTGILLRDFPEAVEEEKWKTDPDMWEELVLSITDREGY